MNEIDLIKEVEKRPILYDKSVSGFNKTKLRDDAWKEVQEALHVSESECKKRWRSLRDSFIKLQRTHGGRTRWPYHQAMRFLLPHIEPKDNGASKKEAEDSDGEEEIRQRAIQCLPDLSYSQDTKYEDDDDDDSQPSPKKARQNSTDDDANPCSCNRNDPDELFLISCAPTLKRLSSKQNALARLKIQQVLLEAEFGSQMELPYVTPASDCDFDAVE
ncbi:uncharacterized protein LOC124633492 [Helicoverpa zea]|uniref:MADF domain-containing protein n=1 Tax=Heliothis virescens TaxID=7102 RepID=A0A2A4JNT6_HELVI|nr:uncharacterized protein LOC110379342 [Helicoverpa armigera]XP_047024689.1 uncharacterized protein LOC124633492 [Helicoverpa zea]PZC86206.1 hypothetical protein B5X24_HaOG211367 [Helicoverpa armigera]